MAELSQRMQVLIKCASEEEKNRDTFAERAEWYYHKRPQLLSLLQDVYNGYTILLDRCSSMESRHRRCSSLSLVVDQHGSNFDREEDGVSSQVDSEAESSLSYQQNSPSPRQNGSSVNIDDMVANLVVQNVEKDLLIDQLRDGEQKCNESSRKIDLMKKLIEVLESERVVLMNENKNMNFRMTGLLEENQGLASEVVFLKRKAAELAKCVLRMRENHKAYVLTRKIEDLQDQIYGLEKRNKEYYHQLLKKDQECATEDEIGGRSVKNKNGGWQMGLFSLFNCFQSEKLMFKRTYFVNNGDFLVKGFQRKWWTKMKSKAIRGLRRTSNEVADIDSVDVVN